MKTPWVKFGLILVLSQLSSALALADSPENSSNNFQPFKPHWGFQIGLTSSGTPGDRGGGQNANDLSFSATREFSEGGDFLSLEGVGGSQKVEGYVAKYGSLSVSGGLGLGIFSPSLSLSAQTGDSAFFATTAGLNLGFQIFDDISLGLNLTGGLSSHETPLPYLFPTLPNVNVEVDGKNWGGGFSVIWATSEIFSLSLSAQATNEITYQLKFKGNNATYTLPIDQSSLIPSSSLGFNWAFIKDFSLSGSVQRSEESQPAGFSYSPSLGETVFNPAPTTLYFSGYSVGLTFSFQ